MNSKSFKKVISLLLAVLLILGIPMSASASSVKTNDVPNSTYTFWGEKKQAYSAKAVYRFKAQFTAKEVGYDFASLTDIANDEDGNSYILDGDNSTVFVLNGEYKYVKSFGNLSFNGEELDFTGASGLEYRNGKVYICDTSNMRVLVVGIDGTVKNVLYLPESDMIPEDFVFRPIRVGVDSSGYVYVLSEGSYYGAILYSPDGEFLGFYGSNTVETGILTAFKTLWEKITMTNEKRANSEKKLPYQFSDLFVDGKDFVYTATGRTSEESAETGQIKRLNPGGTNVLTRSSETYFSDRVPANVRFRTAGWSVIANISSVIADNNGFIYCVDRETSRIFIFDSDCNYITVMGGGNGDADQKTAFKKISGIGLCGSELIILDEKKNDITVMEITEYGKDFLTAQNFVLNGDYDKADKLWSKVLSQDRNNQLAYIGLAKANLAKGNYKSAMEYAKDGKDLETYDQADTFLRNKFLSEHFNLLAVIVIVIVLLIVSVVVIIRKKHIVLIRSNRIKTALNVLTSPVDAFRSVKEKKTGSVLIATVFMILFYLSSVAKNELGGFQFIGESSGDFNSILTLLKTIGAVLLFTVSNWAVATLMQGRGTLKEIYIVTCYSLQPIIIGNFLYAILSNFVSLSEGAFLDIMATVLLLYAALLFIFGLIAIHDVSFGRFLGITVLSIFGILVVIFVGVIVFMLAQQLYSFIMTVINEMSYR